MRLRHILKGFGLLMLLMFTTGIVLPWLISNVIMPLWMIIFTLCGVLALWVVILERPYLRLVKYILKAVQGKKNVD